jgi:predicted nucleotidyltransferase component of viral defense system
MIDAGVIRMLATKHQTTELNVAREYWQHLFLSAFYQQKEAERVLFKGGTALRIIYNSPRFSEDLDFSGAHLRKPLIEELVTNALSDIERSGVAFDIEESKLTTGGYLGILRIKFLTYDVGIQLEVSLRGRGALRSETTLIANDFLPAYTVVQLARALLVDEKLAALAERGKPRDFYDLYFMLRRGLLPPEKRGVLTQIAKRLRTLQPESLNELRLFLPKNQHALVKNFRAALGQELRPYLK